MNLQLLDAQKRKIGSSHTVYIMQAVRLSSLIWYAIGFCVTELHNSSNVNMHNIYNYTKRALPHAHDLSYYK